MGFIKTEDNRALLEVALGNRPADMVIENGILLDVHSGRIIADRSVAIYGQWIAYVGRNAGHTVGDRTQVIDARGKLLAPGYIDVHTHLANYCDLSEVLTAAMAGGTTSYVSEMESFGVACGAEGVQLFLDQIRRQPVKIFCLIPPIVTLSPALAPRFITPEQIRRLLSEDMVVGLGESYWQNAILTSDDRVLALMRETRRAGKSVQGHAAGAVDKKLAAYAAAGAVSCHESVSSEDILARLEMGYLVILREGHIRKDLESLRPLIGQIDYRRMALCTDGVDPDGLIKNGYFVDVVQKAVDMGIPAMEVLRMATLNPAEHLGLSHLIGAVAPGRFADILLLAEPGIMMPELVISQGRIVAEAGRPVETVPKVPLPEQLTRTLHVPRVFPEDFIVPMPSTNNATIRTMDIQSNGLVAREGAMSIDTGQMQIRADVQGDLLKVVFIENVSGRGEKFVGFLRGWGQRQGAVASSLSWDSAGIIAIGANDRDLALAVNQVIEMQGGYALAVNGSLQQQIPHPIVGYISTLPIEAYSRETNAFKDALQRLGVPFASPLLSLVVLTSAAIPFIRITEKGYFRFRENDYVGMVSH